MIIKFSPVDEFKKEKKFFDEDGDEGWVKCFASR